MNNSGISLGSAPPAFSVSSSTPFNMQDPLLSKGGSKTNIPETANQCYPWVMHNLLSTDPSVQ